MGKIQPAKKTKKEKKNTPTMRYKEKLQKQITKHSLLVILIAFLSFIITFTVYITGFNLYRARENNLWLEQSFTEIHDEYESFIKDNDTARMLEQYLLGTISGNTVAQQFYGFERGMTIGADIVMSDQNGMQTYTTLSDEEALHLVVFDRIMHARMNEQKTTAVYTSVYYLKGGSARYVFARNVYDNSGDYIGNISIYIKGDEWNSYLRSKQVDGIITDSSGNVIASSNRSLVDGFNRFLPESTVTFVRDNLQYWMHTLNDDAHGIRFYSLVYDSSITRYLFLGLLAFGLIAAIVMLPTRRLAGNIADINTTSMRALMAEIDKVREQGGDSHIELQSDDEFMTIASHINDMLDSTNALSKRNMALTELNAAMEIKQLEAQFDPHFLYNTLEAIRYAIQLDPASADVVIRKLTQLLRYSISGKDSMVRLGDDMEYLKSYLDIIQFRFADKFSYTIQIDKSFEPLMIPKLLLQTLIENSIKYGFRDKNVLHIDISCIEDEERFILQVSDNGMGMKPERLQQVRHNMQSEEGDGVHLGLHYVARRIALQYGSAGRVQVKSRYGEGTTVEIVIEKEALENGI